jgi:tRNA1(Val) A37 N6-methylase TrmN6
MSAADPRPDLTDDGILGGRLRLLQPRRGHRFGHDAVLLAAATAAQPSDHVVEFGAGVGAAGLALAARVPETRVTLVELNADLCELAAENARRNGLEQRVRALTLDVTAPTKAFAAAGLPPGSAERVMMNPPFNDARRQQLSPDPGRTEAHGADADTLARWCDAAGRLLVPGGTLTLIWRADALADVLAALAPFGAVTVLPVYPRPGAAAIRVISAAVKGARFPLRVAAPLMLNEADGRPSPAAEKILREAAALPI